MSEHEAKHESARERADREGISVVEAIRRLRWEGLEQVKARGEATRMSAITAHVLETRFHVLAESEAAGLESEGTVAALQAYVDGITQAPKLVLLRHQLSLMWATIKRRD